MEARPLVSVIGCFLIYLALGTILTFGNLTPYLTSYLKQRVKKDITYEESSWIFYSYISTSSLLYFGGKLGILIGRRWNIIICSCIFCFGIAVTYWSVQHSLVATIITYGVISTFGYISCSGHSLVTAIEAIRTINTQILSQWFPSKKGLVTGIVSSGIALTPLFMNIVQTLFVNPSNLQPAPDGFFDSDEVLERVPALFLTMASVAGIILLIGLLMYQELPRKLNEEETISSELTTVYAKSRQSCCKQTNESITKDGDCRTTIKKEEIFASLNEDSVKVNVDDELLYSNGEIQLHVPPKKAVKTKEFYLLSVAFICSYYPFIFVNVFYKAYGQTFISDDTFLSTIGSVAGAVHAISRVIVGLIQDKLSYKLTSLFLLGIKTVLLFTLVTTPYGGEVMYMIWICGLFTTFSVAFVCIPAAVAESFGTKYTTEIFGIILFISSSCFFLWTLVLQRITSSLGWFATFCVTAIVSFIGIIVNIFFPETQRTQPILSSSFDGHKEQIPYGSVNYQK